MQAYSANFKTSMLLSHREATDGLTMFRIEFY